MEKLHTSRVKTGANGTSIPQGGAVLVARKSGQGLSIAGVSLQSKSQKKLIIGAPFDRVRRGTAEQTLTDIHILLGHLYLCNH